MNVSVPPRDPPRLAQAFLRWCAPCSIASTITGDLSEEFNAAVRSNEGLAKRLYWAQVVASAFPLLLLKALPDGRARVLGMGAGGVVVGCVAICAGALATNVTAQFLITSLDAIGFRATASVNCARVLDVVVPFVFGGYVTGLVARYAAKRSLFALGGLSVLFGGTSMLGVLPLVAPLGAGVVAYHLLLLASIVPAIALGGLFGHKASLTRRIATL